MSVTTAELPVLNQIKINLLWVYQVFSSVESIYLMSIPFMYPEAFKRKWKLSYSLLLLQQMSFLEINN